MDYMHIIALWVLFVVLVAVYFVAKVWTRKQRIGYESDFITDFINKKDQTIKKNDVDMTLTTYLLILVISPIITGVLVYIFTKKGFFAIGVALCSVTLPDAILFFMKNKENKLFEEKYERSLEQLSSALKAGMSVMQAVKEVSENKFIYEPIRRRYANLYADLTMGVSLKDAFKLFAESTESSDASDVALVIEIQEETGGHEAEAVMLIAKDIRDRLMLRKEIRAMFASTSFMVYTMDVLPFLIMVWLTATNKSYSQYYFSGIHIFYLVGLVGICLLGSILNHHKIRKLLREA